MQAALQLSLPQTSSLPDITISGASVSAAAPQVGQSITINANQQVTSTSGSSISPVLEYRYSTDNVWSTDDLVIGTDISTLGSSISSESENITYTIPEGSGTRYILMRADAQNTVAESNENNNTASISISIPVTSATPDVTVINASVSSASFIAGQTITISCAQRISSASATVFPTIQYRLSTDITWQSTDTFIGSDISALSSTIQSENEDITYVIPNTPGTRYILFKADAGSSIVESNENNNVVAIPITIAAAMIAHDNMGELKSAVEHPTSNIRIFPNPASDRIWIEASDFNWKNVKVFSAHGQLAFTSERSELRSLDELIYPQLPAGMYVLQFSDGIETIAHRLVIE
jgi:hypothetical protein